MPAITISSRDFESLDRLLSVAGGGDTVCALRGELQRARVVEPEQLPADVITMNSRSRLLDERTGKVRELTLVYPQQADAATGRVSVLAPVGSALLGLAAGQAIDWPMPGGYLSRLRVLEVISQPESDPRPH